MEKVNAINGTATDEVAKEQKVIGQQVGDKF
jgi:hypothetical protein